MTSGERWRLLALGIFAFWIWSLSAILTRAEQTDKHCKDKGGVPVAHLCLKKDAVIQ